MAAKRGVLALFVLAMLGASPAAFALIPRSTLLEPAVNYRELEAPGDYASLDNAALLRNALEDALPASGQLSSLAETRVRAFGDLAPFEQQHPSELSRALHQAYAGLSPESASVESFAGGDPVNGRDPTGLLRRYVLRNRPRSWLERLDTPSAEELQQRFVEAERQFVRTPTGAAATARLDTDPNFVLTVEFDPEYTEGLVVKDDQYDANGRAVSATLVIGRRFPDTPSGVTHYPFGSTLTRRNELQVYTLAHEQIGHFLKAVDDPVHNAQKFAVAGIPAQIQQLRAAKRQSMIQQIQASSMTARQRKRALARVDEDLRRWLRSDPTVQNLQSQMDTEQTRVENVADAEGETVVREYRACCH